MNSIRLMRLGGLIRKEWLQVIRDPSGLAIAFVLPLVLLLIFGAGVSLDAKNINIALVQEQPGAKSEAFVSTFFHTPYFKAKKMRNIQEAEEALQRAEVSAIVWLRSSFNREYLTGDSPPIGVIVNGVDANTARLVEGYLQGIWFTWLTHEAELSGTKIEPPVDLQQRIWFNAEVRSTDYLVPGVVAVVMTLIGSLLTALVIAREWERGTMETLLVTRISVFELLAGKLVPYFILGMGGFFISLTMARFLFQVPVRGSLFILIASSALFLLVALGMGLTISTLCRSQFVAALVALITTFLPAFLLSGFIFDIRSMPAVIHFITGIVAARYYVAMLQTLFLAGNIWFILLTNALYLIAMACFFLGITYYKTRKKLD